MAVDAARAKSLFLAASDLADPAERAVFLDRECSGDADLRARVDALLQANDAAPLQAAHEATVDSADGQPGTEDYEDPTAHVGAILAGKYKLIEEIGEGGMGNVFMAQQTEPVKRAVAVKVIKAGMDSRAVLARFEAERQALAMMDHPNIAKVLDADTTDAGRPFFVMELVKGTPITRYCDEHKLTPRQRLELFVPVCQAIQHAHQKGIIHRDIKPTNVLVALYDDRPVPKVIDFGVAKAAGQALTDKTLMTGFGALVGTPEYMSPEQASLNNLDIDTRSDVYSLGVLLYELLTGTTPVDKKSLAAAALLEILRIVREVEAPRPSAKLSTIDTLPSVAANRGTEPAKLSRLMRGELDWLVMKALEKDRTRRYETANALSRDIQRYLADEVVEAQPPSVGYRVSKFVRRHKGQVIAASLVLLALLGGIIGTSIGLVRADREREKAEGLREQAEGLADQNGKLAGEERDAKNKASELATTNAQLAESESKQKNKAIANADELKYQLGVSAMLLANAAYDNHDLKLAAERLDKVPEDQRGWEWHYLKRQLKGGIFTLSGHNGVVASVAFSPDGTRIVTGAVNVGIGRSDSGGPFEAKVWDARTGMYLFDLKGLPPEVPGWGTPVSVAFSPESERIVTAGGDKTARVWDAATGALQVELTERTGDVYCAAFSPDGTQIVTGSGGLVKLWDARTGKALRDWKARGITRVAFSPDSGRILTGGLDQAVRVWDAKTGKLLREAKGMMSADSDVAFSPDGERIVVGRIDGTARVIDAQTGAILLELKGRPLVGNSTIYGSPGVLCVAFSPDGTRIVSGGTTDGRSGWAIVWDARTGAELLELKGHTSLVMSAAFSPDGQRIITGSADHTAKVWEVRTGTPRLELDGIKGPILSAALSPDGTWMVTGGDKYIKGRQFIGQATIWDARTGIPKFVLKGIKERLNSVAISPDGTRIATGGGAEPEEKKSGEATVWDARTGQALFDLKGLEEAVNSLAFSPDGERIITGGSRGRILGTEVKVWDARTGAMLLDLTHQPRLRGGVNGARLSVAFSTDGKWIAVAGAAMGQVVSVRDARTGTALRELKGKSGVVSAAFSRDGTRIATGHYPNTATVWDVETGSALVELKGHTGDVNCVAFGPDGKRVVTGSSDRTVRVWDVQTGATLAELKGHSGAVTSVSYSADGTRILTASSQTAGKPGEVFVWDARTGKEPPDEEEIASRRLQMKPNPWRYRAGYLAARTAKDDFAAAFYLDLIPPDERKGALEQAEADAFAARSKLATEYVNAGKYEEAVPLLTEILNVNKAKLGPEDPATIRAAEMLGGIYCFRTGQLDKAIPLLEDVVKARKAKQDPQTPNAMCTLGLAYRNAGRLKEAIALLEEVAAKHPQFMWDLLDVYALAGEHAKVVALCQKQLAEDRKSRPDADPNADLLACLGRAYLAQKKWSEAESHLRQCVTIREKGQPDHWTTFEAQSLLGEALLGQKKYADAEPLLLKGYEGLKEREKSLEPQNAPRLPEAIDRLIELYTGTNNPDESKKWQAERAKYPNAAPPMREKN
jgi:WD40 repeat protein/serine/threonine protein kinase/tetratricopeptide (TPR) repeat protein